MGNKTGVPSQIADKPFRAKKISKFFQDKYMTHGQKARQEPAVFTRLGKMTRREICEKLELDRNAVSAKLRTRNLSWGEVFDHPEFKHLK